MYVAGATAGRWVSAFTEQSEKVTSRAVASAESQEDMTPEFIGKQVAASATRRGFVCINELGLA